MPSHDRRAAARRRAWGRGPIILRFEPLEGRELMATSAAALPEIVATSFNVTANADWDQPVQASGTIANIGTAPVPPGAIAAIYASPTATVGASSLLVGIVTINAGLAPGATQNFSETVTMPPSPLPNMTTASTQLWYGLDIDPQGVVPQQNPKLNKNQGVGLDEAPVTITAVPPSNLIGTVFNLNTTTATWGQTITITAQIQNNAQGDAPATRAKIVLTPNGEAPGTLDDITVGNISVPPLAPFQTTNVVAQVTLPPTPPPTLAGQSTFQITMVQDADHQASALVQPPTVQGVGQDTAAITITNGPLTTPVGVLPDLAAGTVTAPTTALYWGDGFQVSAVVQNIGQAAAPAFNVEFLLTGTDGLSDGQAIYLGSALIAGGLAPGFSQTVTQDLTLPSRLPYGMTVGSLSYGRIVAILDPENLVDETFKNNNSAESAPVSLRIFGVDGNATVPTAAPVHSNAPIPAGKVTTKPVSPPPPPPSAVVTRRQAANRAKVLKLSEAQLIKAQLALVKLQQARGAVAKSKAESNTLSAKLTSQVNNLTQIVKDLL